jgi:hypothetical protein
MTAGAPARVETLKTQRKLAFPKPIARIRTAKLERS